MTQELDTFNFRGDYLQLKFVESSQVFPGVTCDVYAVEGSEEKDLGVITVDQGKRTQPQKILGGEETIEGYISGRGKLVIVRPNGERLEFEVGPEDEGFSHPVEIGETMQWQAAENEKLVFYEVCFPPYQDGRFENLEDGEL